MSSHRELGAGGEDPHAEIAAALGGKNERRFGEVHLAGDGLHLDRRQPLRLGEHGELIAFERAVGEDVEVKVAHR
jgi:hypothetical protein